MRKPTVLLALPTPPPWSGQERLTECLLACGLDSSFNLVHVNTSLGEGNAQRGKFGLARFWRALLVNGRVIAALVQHRPDILNVPLAKNRLGFLRAACMILSAKLCGVRVVSRLGGDHFDRFYQECGLLMRTFVRFVLSRIDAVVVRADCLKPQFRGLVPPERLHRVYLGLDVDAFTRPAFWSRPSDDCVRILFVGHLSRAKGAFDLLRAIPAIVAAYPRARFTFAGETIGEERDVMHVAPGLRLDAEREALLQDPIVRQVATFVHARTTAELQALYWNADVFVLPSYSEGFPFAALEAMAAGLPLVVSPAGALAEILVPGTDALVVSAGDPAALARAVVTLCRDRERRAALATRSSALVRERFTLAHLRTQMTGVYEHVLWSSSATAKSTAAARQMLNQRSD